MRTMNYSPHGEAGKLRIKRSELNSLAVIIPMYNEEDGAVKCVDRVIEVLKELPIKSLLIVVNDGSRDKTKLILQQKEKQYSKYVHLVSYSKNKGYGGATQEGLEKAQRLGFSWVIHMDSDLTNNPKYINDFLKYIDFNFDCIKASRYVKGGRHVNVPLFRQVISFIGNYVASNLFAVGIKDCTNGFRMVRLERLKGIKFKESNFSIILEELYYLKKLNAKFTEIPYTLTARVGSVSHFNYKPKIFFDYFKYALLSFFI